MFPLSYLSEKKGFKHFMLGSMDLINSLPEEILCHILSFLSTKEAVSTSVLTKRWRSLWTRLPNLDIDDSVFFYPEEGKREREGILQSFIDFVDRVLALHDDSPIKKFSLKCKSDVDPDRVILWISNVLQRGVSDLELCLDLPLIEDIYHMPDEMFPDGMFVSKTLVNVKLRSSFGIGWWSRGPREMLPTIKTLYIDSEEWVLVSDNLELFLDSLPCLEELYLDTVEWYDSDETVSSTSLRKLTLYAKGFQEISDPMNISFDIPNLVDLDYSDYVAADYPEVNLTNLVEAELNLLLTGDQLKLIRAPIHEDDVVIQRFRNVSKLMSGMRNVRELILTAYTLEVLSLSCDSMPVFNNLKCLHIKSQKELGWQAMPVLLRKCPHLEYLVLEGLIHYVTDKCGDFCDCIIREDKGLSLASSPVTILEIQGFLGTMKEMGMIKHFLKYFPSLKEMDIFVEKDEPTELRVPEVRERIMQMIGDYNKLSSCDIQLWE